VAPVSVSPQPPNWCSRTTAASLGRYFEKHRSRHPFSVEQSPRSFSCSYFAVRAVIQTFIVRQCVLYQTESWQSPEDSASHSNDVSKRLRARFESWQRRKSATGATGGRRADTENSWLAANVFSSSVCHCCKWHYFGCFDWFVNETSDWFVLRLPFRSREPDTRTRCTTSVGSRSLHWLRVYFSPYHVSFFSKRCLSQELPSHTSFSVALVRRPPLSNAFALRFQVSMVLRTEV
jgi:hypothetical protein